MNVQNSNKNIYYLIFRGNNKEIAKAEFETLWEVYFNEKIKINEVQNVLSTFNSINKIEKNSELLKRITYTNYLGKVISKSKNIEDLNKEIKNTNLDEFENKTFSTKFKKSKSGIKTLYLEKDYAKLFWNNINNPKVDLKNPQIEFNPIIYENQKELIICENLFENQKDYSKRMPKLRPIKMPYTLKSDMARASVNLLKLKPKKNSIVLDPFCGIGGILLEAYDMKFEIIANDISWNDLKYLKKNFDYYYPNSKYTRILADSTTRFLKENTIDGIVTDIPYGKSSRRLGNNIYDDFLRNAKIYLKPGARLVIIYANFLEFKSIAKKYFTQVLEIDEYINKSMTRHILILENKK